jgi:cytochrome c-type biogenesis protein CcmH
MEYAMKIIKTAFIFMLGVYAITAMAAQDIYSFNTPFQQAQFEKLTMNLRCLVCQNQSLADSNAPLAQDLRGVIATQVKQEKSDQQIIDFLTQRYGEFILYKPPFNTSTYLLWLAPLIFVLGGGVLLLIVIRRSSRGETR